MAVSMQVGVPGLSLVSGWLGADERQVLLEAVDAGEWSNDLRRRVQQFGWRYDHRRRTVDRESFLGPLPGHLAPLAVRLADEGWAERAYDQIIVNEYLPGQGIAAHTDCVPCFGPSVASVSLTGACEMVFDLPGSDERVPVWLEPGALLVMRGPGRDSWRHRIAARNSDVRDGEAVPRSRRVSLTFRTVHLQ